MKALCQWRCKEYLETALDRISHPKGMSIDAHMGAHRFDTSIEVLVDYFNSVIDRVSGLFETTENMAGLDWGLMFEEYHSKPYDHAALNFRVNELLQDESIRKRSNIYEYVLSGEESRFFLKFGYSRNRQRRLFTIGRQSRQEQTAFQTVRFTPSETTTIGLTYINLKRWMLTTSPLGAEAAQRL